MRAETKRPWRTCKLDHLAHLAVAEPRALDICVADEIHVSGLCLTAVRRLGAGMCAPCRLPHVRADNLVVPLDAGSAGTPGGLAPRGHAGRTRVLTTDVVRALQAHED
jgi:hypothetical protein